MYFFSFFIYVLQILFSFILYAYGNYFLEIPEWSKFATLQYTALIIVSLSWFGTDISGIRVIADSDKKSVGSEFLSIVILRNFFFLVLYLMPFRYWIL